ncbi:MAG: hypothetical protein ACRCW9_06220 [Cetobacterium sp.]
MLKVGYIKRRGVNNKFLPSGFNPEDFKNQTPILQGRFKLNGAYEDKLSIQSEEGQNFLLYDYNLYLMKKILHENDFYIEGYFKLEIDSDSKEAALDYIEDFEELKKKEIFYQNDLSKKLKTIHKKKSTNWLVIKLPEEINFSKYEEKALKGKLTLEWLSDAKQVLVVTKFNLEKYELDWLTQEKKDFFDQIIESQKEIEK